MEDSSDTNPIKFYRANGSTYGCFSNFSRHSLWLKGKSWATSEHYFQAQKFAGTPYEEEVRLQPSPGKAASKGRSRSLPLRKDWESVKDSVMYDALKAKFTQRKDLKEILVGTGNREIIEDSPIDYYWGCGQDGSGKNMLGKLLMRLREDIRNGVVTKEDDVEKEEDKEEKKVEVEEVVESGSEDEEVIASLNEEYGTTKNKDTTNEYADYKIIRMPGSQASKSSRKKKGRAKQRRDVFRYADGTPKIDKNPYGDTFVQGSNIKLNNSALSSSAKTVIFQERKKRHVNQQYIPEDEGSDIEDELDETQMQYLPPSQKATLFSFLPQEKKAQFQPTEADFGDIHTIKGCLIEGERLILEEIKGKKVNEFKKMKAATIRNNLVGFIQESESHDEEELMKVMSLIESLNDYETAYASSH